MTQAPDLEKSALWQLDVCNACRYCEGYCAVFPALERRRRASPSDLVYLANLCHDCRACYYACMYAPPHEFGVNIPQTLAAVRERTYAEYAFPRVVSNLARGHGALLIGATIVALLLFGAIAVGSGDPRRIFAAQTGPGSFYVVVPYLGMMLPAMLLSLYAIAVLIAGAFAFARESHAPAWRWRAMVEAVGEALSLRYLRGGTAGACFYPTERVSDSRRVLHMLVFYGFVSAAAATFSAFILQDFLGQLPPYPVLSVPVVLGVIGGIGLIGGSTGLLWLKYRSDRAPADHPTYTLDTMFLISLNIVAITGMLLLMLRETAAMGTLLIVHLATVLALYVSAPYGKFAHLVYRFAALVQNRLESDQSGARVPGN